MKFPVPDQVVGLIDKADRKKLGLKTQDEIAAAVEVKSERELHRAVASVLRLRGIEFFESRMDRKTTRPKGEPDFLFAVWSKPDGVVSKGQPEPCAWELKRAGRKLDADQVKMFERMTASPNTWCCRVIHSVDEALEELRRLGL